MFAAPAETTERLRAAGFDDVRCWLHAEPTTLPPEDLPCYLRTVCLGGVLEAIDGPEREDLVHAVAGCMEQPVLDYVRLDISARRAVR